MDLDYNRNYNRIRVRFETCDQNEDGKLDLEEFLLFKNPFQQKHIVDNFKKASMRRVDKNSDGKISLEEYQRDWIKIPEKFDSALRAVDDDKLRTGDRPFLALVEFLRHETEMFHNFFDVDNDGELNGLDIILWLSPENSEMQSVSHSLAISIFEGNLRFMASV